MKTSAHFLAWLFGQQQKHAAEITLVKARIATAERRIAAVEQALKQKVDEVCRCADKKD